MGLKGNVESGRRLIAYEDIGFARKRNANHHALTLPPAHLVGIFPSRALGGWNAYFVQHLDRPLSGLRLAHVLMQDEGLRDLIAYAHHGVQTRERILHDKGDLVTSNAKKLLLRKLNEVLALKEDLPRSDLAGRLKHPHHGERRHGLSATGFPDHAQSFPRFDGKRNPAQNLRLSKGNLKTSNVEHWHTAKYATRVPFPFVTTLLATWNEPGHVAIQAAWAARQSGADLRTTLEKGLAAAELDPNLLAIGLGSLPNSDGELELDASMMDGRDLSAGAVCAVRGICPVISVARKVMEDTKHVMLAGDQARRFAIAKGFRPQNLMTAEAIKHYETWKVSPEALESLYVHAVSQSHDTVTMLGLEDPEHCVAASATSGWAFKMPGRVGDSPIIGAGIYADDEVGCAGATGLGEELLKAAASFRAVEAMRSGLSAQEACDQTVRQMMRRQPSSLTMPCVVFALRRDGDFGASTTKDEFPLWICRDGSFELRHFGVPA